MIIAATLYTGATSNLSLLLTVLLLMFVALLLPDSAQWRRVRQDKRVIVGVLLLACMAIVGSAVQAIQVPCPCSGVERWSWEWWLAFCYLPSGC